MNMALGRKDPGEAALGTDHYRAGQERDALPWHLHIGHSNTPCYDKISAERPESVTPERRILQKLNDGDDAVTDIR